MKWEREDTLPREDQRGLQHGRGSPVLLVGSVRWSLVSSMHSHV